MKFINSELSPIQSKLKVKDIKMSFLKFSTKDVVNIKCQI